MNLTQHQMLSYLKNLDILIGKATDTDKYSKKKPLSRRVLKDMGFSRQEIENILWIAEQNGGINDYSVVMDASDNLIFSCER